MALVIAMACAIAVMVIGGAVGFVAPVHMRCVRLGVPRGLSLVTHAASRDPHVGIPHNRPGDIAYRSPLLDSVYEYDEFVRLTRRNRGNDGDVDIFWEQIQYEASSALRIEPEAGPQLYQGILSQPSLLEAICTRIAHEIETELIPATEIKSLFLEMINPDDEQSIRLDLQAVATRTPSVENAMTARKYLSPAPPLIVLFVFAQRSINLNRLDSRFVCPTHLMFACRQSSFTTDTTHSWPTEWVTDFGWRDALAWPNTCSPLSVANSPPIFIRLAAWATEYTSASELASSLAKRPCWATTLASWRASL
jgi:hypothetical protein